MIQASFRSDQKTTLQFIHVYDVPVILKMNVQFTEQKSLAAKFSFLPPHNFFLLMTALDPVFVSPFGENFPFFVSLKHFHLKHRVLN